MKKTFRQFTALLLFFIILFPQTTHAFNLKKNQATAKKFLVLGEDLSDKQVQEILEELDLKEEDYKLLFVSNKEEHELLSGHMDKKQIGSRSISSVFMEFKEDSYGLDVKTSNIDFVTNNMYSNVLTTLGVKDAKVRVISPVKVSGTAGLVGLIKAIEEATGEDCEKEVKDITVEETMLTGSLVNDIGEDVSEKFMQEVKLLVKESIDSDPEQINKIVIATAKKYKIKLTEDDIKAIVELMNKMSNIEIDVSAIREQLNSIGESLNNIKVDKGFFANLIEKIKDFFKALFFKNKESEFIGGANE